MNNLVEANKKIKDTLTLESRKDSATKLYLINPSMVFYENDELREALYDIYVEISHKFNVPITCIFLTGSAHIGFSLKKGHDFSSEVSDLDIAIINAGLFNYVLTQILEGTDSYRLGHLFIDDRDNKGKKKIDNFKGKLIQGVLHPLYFPKIQFTMNWNSFFRELTRKNQKFFQTITGCIYLSEECFRINQEDSLRTYIEKWSKL